MPQRFLYRYGVIAVHVARFPNGAVESVSVAYAQFIPRSKQRVYISTERGAFVLQDGEDIDEGAHAKFCSDMLATIEHLTSIFSRYVLLYNEDAYFSVNHKHRALLSDLIIQQKIKKRALSADEGYFEHCKTAPFHASMDRQITAYEHVGAKRDSEAYDMIANYLDKNRHKHEPIV